MENSALNLNDESPSSVYCTEPKQQNVNRTQVLVLPHTTIVYGQTPKTIGREHFSAIAQKLGLSEERLARKVTKMSIQEKLELLRNFYVEKVPEVETVYHTLSSSLKDEESKNDHAVGRDSDLKTPVLREDNVEGLSQKRKRVRKISSSSSDDEINESRDCQTASIKKSEIAVQTEPVSSRTDSEKPLSMCSYKEFETFLFGEISPKKKPAPAKPKSKDTLDNHSFLDSRDPVSVIDVETIVEEPPSPKREFVPPSITFDASKWSPAPQRSMLDIVKDLSKAKRLLEMGQIPQSSVPFL